MTHLFKINLTGVSNQNEIFERFYSELKISDKHGYNWDAFSDNLRSIMYISGAIKSLPTKPSILLMAVHGIESVEQNVPEEDLMTLTNVLLNLTNKEQREDNTDIYVQIN